MFDRSSNDYIIDANNHIEKAKAIGIQSRRADRLLSFSRDSLSRGDHIGSRLLALFAKKEVAQQLSRNDIHRMRAAFFNVELKKLELKINELENSGVNVIDQKKEFKRALAMFNAGRWPEVDKSLRVLELFLFPKVVQSTELDAIDVDTLIEDSITEETHVRPPAPETVPRVEISKVKPGIQYNALPNEICLLETLIKQSPVWYNNEFASIPELNVGKWPDAQGPDIEERIASLFKVLGQRKNGVEISDAGSNVSKVAFINSSKKMTKKDVSHLGRQIQMIRFLENTDLPNKAYLAELSMSMVQLRHNQQSGMAIAYIGELEGKALENKAIILGGNVKPVDNAVKFLREKGITPVFSDFSEFPDPVLHAIEDAISLRNGDDVLIGILLEKESLGNNIIGLLASLA